MNDETWPRGFSEIADAVLGRSAKDAGAMLWLREAILRYGGLVEKSVGGGDVSALNAKVDELIAAGQTGEALSSEAIVERAKAALAEDAKDVTLRGCIDVIVASTDARSLVPPVEAPVEAPAEKPAESGGDADRGDAATPAQTPTNSDTPEAKSPQWGAEAAGADAKGTPTLDRFGRDLTAAVRAGNVPRLIGRDTEVETLIEVLCRTTKRNPLLVGPPGSGKTAIVEGFAARVVAGEVPEFLIDVRIVAIDVSSLTGGTGVVGEFEERLEKLLKEAARPDIILFIDEAHMILQAGGKSGGLADMLKPALARGDLALIAATTDDEYRRFIKSDKALERRFQPVLITEMSPEATLEILKLRRDGLAEKRNVSVDDDTLSFLVHFAAENMRSRTFPDKAIDLLEQCVAYASSRRESAVTRAIAGAVVSRLVGATVEPAEALERVAPALERVGMIADDALRIATRLQATLHGLDRRTQRPNLVLALGGNAGLEGVAIAESIAGALYGAADRVLNLDLGQIRSDEAISMLLGSPPGYVGYERPLAIHDLAVTPRCVVLVEGADVCHPLATETLAQACADGYFTDTAGDRYFLSDATVVITAPTMTETAEAHTLGFIPADAVAPDRITVERLRYALGSALAGEVDVVVSDCGPADTHRDYSSWIEESLMPAMIELYAKRGIDLTWDEDVLPLIGDLCAQCSSRKEVERVAEELLSQAVIRAFDGSFSNNKGSVRLASHEGALTAVLAKGESSEGAS